MNALDRVVDTRPLRAHPAFRRLWTGSAASILGGQVAMVAVLYQVWELTHSAAWVGMIGAASGASTIVFGLLGGVLADTVDRRRLVLAAGVAAMGAGVLLAVQAGMGLDSLALVITLVTAQNGCGALAAAARRTFVTRLLPRELVPAGVALNHIAFQAALLLGPALAGVVLARWGLTPAYALDAATTVAALYGVARLPRIHQDGAAGVSLRTAWDGCRFVLRRPVLSGAMAADLAATVLAMPVALFPVLNEERFGGDPQTLGLFLSAIAVGGVTAGLTAGTVTRAARPGLVMLAAAAVWGLALTGFGLVGSLPGTLACLAVAGAADMISVISRGALVQLATPDAFRGRVSSVEYIVGAGGPGIGDARAGWVAGLTSASFAAASGGIACVVVVAALAVACPALRRWRSDADAEDAGTQNSGTQNSGTQNSEADSTSGR